MHDFQYLEYEPTPPGNKDLSEAGGRYASNETYRLTPRTGVLP